jgi:N-acetylglucosaminyldiphosphoundecaprenol N-acetyl-beta-D-mannosaminyltransferase
MSIATVSREVKDAPPERTPLTVPLMGLDFAAVSESDTIDYILGELADGRGGWVCTANLDVLRQWRTSAEMRKLVSSADLVVADGMPLIWAGGLQGTPLPERVAGSTLLMTLTAAAAEAGASVFLLGGNPGTAELTARILTARSPDLRLAGTLCPPFGFERQPDSLWEIERLVGAAAPDIIYVGLGFDNTVRLIADLRIRFPDAWFVCCGVGFSFASGEIRRAPLIVQRVGLEWLHRMVQEPRRLYRRYLMQGVPFLVRLLASALATRVMQPRR